jgi:hypothetical protein
MKYWGVAGQILVKLTSLTLSSSERVDLVGRIIFVSISSRQDEMRHGIATY